MQCCLGCDSSLQCEPIQIKEKESPITFSEVTLPCMLCVSIHKCNCIRAVIAIVGKSDSTQECPWGRALSEENHKKGSHITEVSLIVLEDAGLESMAAYVGNDRLFRVSNKALSRLSLD